MNLLSSNKAGNSRPQCSLEPGVSSRGHAGLRGCRCEGRQPFQTHPINRKEKG